MKKYLFLFILIFITACKDTTDYELGNPFQEYLKTDKSQRLIEPYSYIDHLKKTRFKNYELDSLPIFGIILHDTQLDDYFSFLEIKPNEVKKIQLGQVNPNYLCIIHKEKLGVNFIINPGLPGAGGIATQAAVLGALGIKYIVHIGTCGLFGKQLNDSSLIVSQGAYNDGGAMLLDQENSLPRKTISYPDSSFNNHLIKTANENNISIQKSYGITIPIFFFQPIGFVKYALDENNFDKNEVPYYIEMEGAPFFATGKLMKTKVASIVAGTDRYIIQNDSIKHSFVSYDADRAKMSAVILSIKTFNALAK
jgi:purine-nucleoside phosphorylase